MESGDLVSFTYTGQEMDKHLGVMNYNARLEVYPDEIGNPSLSRFLSADPMREFHSPYNYVGNNPFSFTDPSGMGSSIPLKEVPVPIVSAPDPLPYTYWDTDYSGAYSASRGTGPMQSAASDAARVDMGKGFRTLSVEKEDEFNRRMDAIFYGYTINIHTGISTNRMIIHEPWNMILEGDHEVTWDNGYSNSTEIFRPGDENFHVWVNNPNAIPLYTVPEPRTSSDRDKYDLEKSVKYLNDHAYGSYSKETCGYCAKAVRTAIKEGGLNTNERPNSGSAKDYGPSLIVWGFRQINVSNYVPLKGDVRVIQNYPGGNVNGHMDMFNGKQWVSDFKQNGFWPGPGYRKYTPAYSIYRW